MRGKLLSLIICFLFLNINIAGAVTINDASVFVKQPSDGDKTCVFTSCLNMFRRRAIIDGRSDWHEITHSAYKNAITTDGATVRWTITDVKGMNGGMVTVDDKTVAQKKKYFISMLEQHPEGIVIYCPSSPMHTVLLTDYSNGIFYCAETLGSYPTGRIPLTSSWQGKNLSQDEVIAKITKIWYITNRGGIPAAEGEVTVKSDKYAVDISVSGLSQGAILYTAVYDNNGVLVDYVKSDITPVTNKAYAEFKKYPDLKYVKIFLWDKSMRPLAVADINPIVHR